MCRKRASAHDYPIQGEQNYFHYEIKQKIFKLYSSKKKVLLEEILKFTHFRVSLHSKRNKNNEERDE